MDQIFVRDERSSELHFLGPVRMSPVERDLAIPLFPL